MQRFVVDGRVYLTRERPFARTGTVEEALRRAAAAAAQPPELIYWDLSLEADAEGCDDLHLAPAGLDPLLAANYDLSACLAIEEQTMRRLARGRPKSEAAAVTDVVRRLVRAPHVPTAYAADLISSAPVATLRGGAGDAMERAASVSMLSVAVLSGHDSDNLLPMLEAVRAQEVTARLEVLILISGGTVSGARARARQTDAWAAEHGEVRLRRFLLSGDLDRAYLANVGVAIAVGDVVVIADVHCVPDGPAMLQTLADWADGGRVATATPRIEAGGALIAAGLAVTAGGEDVAVATFRQDVCSDGLRLCAAPAPWMFATRRRGWLASGGVGSHEGAPLWTASMAAGEGPKGRHLLIGSQRARWIGDTTPDCSPSPMLRRLRASSATALRVGTAALQDIPRAIPAPLRAEPVIAATRAVEPAFSSLAAHAPDITPRFADADPAGRAAVRPLIFADALGASQAIAFVEGLARARGQGEACVTIVTEADLSGVGGGMDAAVASLFDRFTPTVVVASRLGEPAIWRAALAQARSRGLPVLCHIDDDLLHLPPTLGIERYRSAQHPQRLHTLYAALQESDLTIASTPRLATVLALAAGHARIVVMGAGAAANAPVTPAGRAEGELRIGYMGAASHNHDLAMIVPALNRILADNPQVRLTLFGSIGKQPAARALAGAVTFEPGVHGDYAAFRARLAELSLDIGLAPLRSIDFNRSKTATKWLEYSEAGAAVLASDLDPYRRAGAAGALLLASDGGWRMSLQRLIDDADLRETLVRRSAGLIRREYGWDHLEANMMRVLTTAGVLAAQAA